MKKTMFALFMLSGILSACTLANDVNDNGAASNGHFILLMSEPTNQAVVSSNLTIRGSAYHEKVFTSAFFYYALAGATMTNIVPVNWNGVPLVTLFGSVDLVAGQQYTVWLQATDSEGVTTRSESHQIQVSASQTNYTDTQAPVLAVTAPTNGQSVGENLTLAGTVSDDYSGVQSVYVSLNSGSFQPALLAGQNWSLGMVLSQSGNNTLKVFAVDMAGNVSATNNITVNLDNSLPSVNISNPVHGIITNVAGFTVSGTANVDGSTIKQVYVSLNGGSRQLAVGTAGWSYFSFSFSQGTNTLLAYAIAQNNKTNQSAVTSFVVDTVAPALTVSTPGNGAVLFGSNVNISGTASDSTSGLLSIMVSVDGGTYQSASGLMNWAVNTSLGEGLHTVSVVALDLAMNTSSTSSMAFTITNTNHNTAPPVVGASPAGGDFYSSAQDVTLSLQGTDIVVARYTLNGDDPAISGTAFTNGQVLSVGGSLAADQSVTLKVFSSNSAGSDAEQYIYTKREGDVKPYITNPTLGKYISVGTIQIDGAHSAGEWTDDMLIALDFANDDPRSLGDNWTMHETPWDLTHLYAAWDDNNLYLGWQYVDTTDIYDPSNAGSSAGTKVHQMNLIQLLIIDTIQGQGATHDMWGKNGGQQYFGGDDLPEFQVYVAGNLWQGYISEASNDVFVVDDDGTYYQKFMQNPSQGSTVGTPVGDRGIEMAWITSSVSEKLWGVWDADNALAQTIDPNDVMDFNTMGHDKGRDTFYEMKIPLSALGITKAYLESTGIGVKLGQGEYSCMDTIPQDTATSDTPGTTDSNSPKEWEDEDLLTTPFARIGHSK